MSKRKPEVGDPVMWEDENGIPDIYEIVRINGKDAWLWSGDMGKEVQVTLSEVDGKIIGKKGKQ